MTVKSWDEQDNEVQRLKTELQTARNKREQVQGQVSALEIIEAYDPDERPEVVLLSDDLTQPFLVLSRSRTRGILLWPNWTFFYNEAVLYAFLTALPAKTLRIAESTEVCPLALATACEKHEIKQIFRSPFDHHSSATYTYRTQHNQDPEIEGVEFTTIDRVRSKLRDRWAQDRWQAFKADFDFLAERTWPLEQQYSCVGDCAIPTGYKHV